MRWPWRRRRPAPVSDLKYKYHTIQVSGAAASKMQSFDAALRDHYLPALQDQLKADIGRTVFGDGTYGPPEPYRPHYGPPEPPTTVCGDIFCPCCAESRREWDDHDCW